jgi:hypothetical protein
MTRKQDKFIKIIDLLIAGYNMTTIYKQLGMRYSEFNEIAIKAQKIVYKMKINNDSSKIAYYIRQLFKTPLFQPREMSSHDKHQWSQAKAIFQEMQSMNESDKALKVGFTGWEDQQLEKYGLHTDNIHVQPDGTVLITETLKSRL